jgi:ATP-dependent exoDNAse (exonuclease V) alpha subunit
VAIYHLTAGVIGRGRGQRIVAVAAARSASRLRDRYYGMLHNHVGQAGVVHSELMAPSDAPAWVQNREELWNRVEAGERRKDAQLARAIEIALPAELSTPQCIALLREYVAQQFVVHGMIADLNIRRLFTAIPQAHILLTLRLAMGAGFGPKVRQWNRKDNLLIWRSAWAESANRHLAAAGQPVRIDHRSLIAQQIELTPARKTGVGPVRAAGASLPRHLRQRLVEQRLIARHNGELILADPEVALRALGRRTPVFSRAALVQFLQSRTADAAQLAAVLQAIERSPELVPLEPAAGGADRFTCRDLLEAEKSLRRRAAAMSRRGDLKTLTMAPGENWREQLSAAREAWDALGLRLRCTPGHGEPWLHWDEPVTRNDVMVVDGSEMLAVWQLERLLAVADKARAKLVLVGDARQLERMGAGSPLHAVLEAAV